MTVGHRNIYLVGFMGAGKTTVGRRVAQRLALDFVDTDAEVERRTGRGISTLFEEWGEGRFRREEWEALLALVGPPARVVATGGGTFLGVAQRRFMASRGLVVWLDAPLAECAQRVGRAASRPRWPQGDAYGLRALFEKRRAAYSLAARRVDASAPIDAVVDSVALLAVGCPGLGPGLR